MLPAPGRAVDLQVRVSAPVTGSELPILLLSHGHGPSNHFDVLIQAGGRNKVTGDYLYRSYPAMHFDLGAWGLFRVEDAKSDPALCGGR